MSTIKSHIFKDEEEVRDVVFEYNEIIYNRFRKHQALGYRSPIEFTEASQKRLLMAA